MKKLFFIACVAIATTLLSSQSVSPVEQLVRIMKSTAEDKRYTAPCNLARERNPNDYQDVYNLVTKHPELLKGIIYDGRTFAFLCVERGYADVLERLINEGSPVDLATPCYECGPHEPQTTVLHELFREVAGFRICKNAFPEDYVVRITELTKLIINKYPDLLDIPVYRNRTARDQARFWGDCGGLYDLIPRNLPQSPCK